MPSRDSSSSFPDLPGSATGIAALPTPAVDAYLGFEVTNYQPGFAVAYRLVAQVDVVRFFDDAFAAPERPFLQRTAAFGLPPTPSGFGLARCRHRHVALERARRVRQNVPRRGVGQMPCRLRGWPERQARDVRERCRRDAVQTCLEGCTRFPLGVLHLQPFPPPAPCSSERCGTANTSGSSEGLTFYDSLPVSAGPSRVVFGVSTIAAIRRASFVRAVFVVCFDARAIIVYDPAERRVDG